MSAADADNRERRALVVGATGGIGRATAKLLAERGFALLLSSRRPGPLEQLASALGAKWVAADAANEEDIRRVVAEEERFDVVVHTAGVVSDAPLKEETPEGFDAVMRANLRSAFVLARAVVPKLVPGSRLVFISSTAGVRGLPGFSAYSASKGGLNAFAEAIAGELKRDGIHVNVVSPGPVDTEMLSGDAARGVPLLQPEAVAEAIGFLASLPRSVAVSNIVLRGAVEVDSSALAEGGRTAAIGGVRGRDAAIPVDPKAGFADV